MRSLSDIIFVRRNHVCPWYCCWSFDNIVRRWLQEPYTIISRYIHPGDIVVDIGPGQGYFSIPMAHRVGETGRVIAIDIQPQMLTRLKEKAEQADIGGRITYVLTESADSGLIAEADFALAFWMVHEVPEKELFLRNIYTALKPGKQFLIAEPYLHVSKQMMDETIRIAQTIGFRIDDRPAIFFSRSILLMKE